MFLYKSDTIEISPAIDGFTGLPCLEIDILKPLVEGTEGLHSCTYTKAGIQRFLELVEPHIVGKVIPESFEGHLLMQRHLAATL